MTPLLELGLYDPGCPPRLAPLTELEQLLGAPVKVISWYQAWGSGSSQCYPHLVLEAQQRGLKPLITWEPWKLPTELPAGTPPQAQPDFCLEKIASGLYDNYTRSWARALARAAVPVLLRPMHEMNGNWYPWGGMVNDNHPATFTWAWKHLRRLFLQEGAHNVRWVWCPFAHSVPNVAQNSLEAYFPGEAEIDWLALDIYNHVTRGARWHSFNHAFEEPYRRLCALAPDKPMMIAEIGCAEAGGDKAAWIKEALHALSEKYQRVEVLVWFNVNKECDWRIESSHQALRAFREMAPRFSS
jgi:beta-mannanase